MCENHVCVPLREEGCVRGGGVSKPPVVRGGAGRGRRGNTYKAGGLGRAGSVPPAAVSAMGSGGRRLLALLAATWLLWVPGQGQPRGERRTGVRG